MGMPKIDFDKMYEELHKADPKSINQYGIVINEKTIPILERHSYIQKSEYRKEAVDYNKELLKKFKSFLKYRSSTERIYSDVEWYSDFNNNMSGYTLKFDEMDEEHFNYLLFNRCIRKVGGMNINDYLEVMDSLGVFGEFLKEQGIKNWELFIKIANQKEKMKKRLEEYEKLNILCDKGKITDEEYGEKIEELFGYGYME